MNIRHLKVLVEVCRCKNMSQAARNLFIAQPSVSQTISELEEHFQVKIFERYSRTLYLTEEGELLLSYAQHITTLFDEMELSLHQSFSHQLLRFGATLTVGTCLMCHVEKLCQSKFPNLDISVIVENTKLIEQRLLANELDLAIVEGTCSDESLIQVSIMEDELVLACSASHPFATLTSITPNQLEGQPMILREKGSGTRDMFEAQMKECGISIRERWTCSNAEAIKNAVAANLGVTVISKLLINKEINEKTLISLKIAGFHLKRSFKLVYHKNKYLSPTFQDVLDCIRNLEASL